MKRILSFSLVGLLTLSLISCSSGIKSTTSTNPENYSDLDKEYGQFNTKALTVSYLKKKLDKWKKDNNGKKMLRELEYAKFKHINVLEQVINSQPDSYAYYEGLKSFIEITSKEGNDAAFKAFIVSLSPDPTVSTTLEASNITTTSFTANWSVVTNATGYMLIVDNGTPIDVGNVTSKDITGLSAGSSHSYVVKSVNEGGTSEASSPVNVTLKTDAPVASDATSLAQTSFTANWGSVSGATSYKLFVDNTEVYTGSSTSCNVTSLAVGSSHSYYVQAINSGGTSANSNTINLTLNPAIAGVPVANNATGVTQTGFTANWSSVSGATSYKLKVDSGAFTDVGNITSKNITGLTPGSTHTYVVQAVNISGTSADSNTISFTLIAGNPNATAPTDITNTSFTANWNAITGATSYKLFIDDVEAYSGTDLSFNKTGLSPNSTHNYYVKAVNASGTSPIGNNISLTLKTDAPVASSATSITDTSFIANWGTVTGATGYNLFVDGTSVYTGTSTSANITGLLANSSHSYYVTATNAGGTSTNSNTINLTLNPATPVTPTASAATNITNTSFTANWASVSGATTYKLKVDSGAFTDVGNVTHYDVSSLTPASTHTYTVQASNINGTSSNSTPDISVTLKTDAPVASAATSITDTSFTANWNTVTGATGYNLFVDGISVYTGTSTSANITGLTANSSHSYYVIATNTGGNSTNSNTVNLTLNPATPVTPSASPATNITTTGFTANWASVSGATSYKLKVDSGSFTDIGNVTSYAVTGLTAGTTHTYTVQASNINGTSSNSTPDISVTLKTIAPVASSATSITDTSFTANWNTVTGATGYKLYVDSVNVYTGASTSVNVTGLSSGVTHNYYVQATNAGGNSANSNTINALTLPSAPVANAATSITDTSFTANWASVSGATSYKIKIDIGSFTDIGNVTSYNVTGLTANTAHTYTVQAVNATGTSANSNTMNVTTVTSAPVATSPTDLTSTSYVAHWNAVTGATGYNLNGIYIGNVTSYNVTGLTAGSTNTYTIQAVNAGGNSANSNTVSLTLFASALLNTHIAYSSNKNGNFDIYKMNYNGTTEVQLTNTPDFKEQGPILSKDGTKIVYYGYQSSLVGQYSTLIMNSDGTNVIPFLTYSTTSYAEPSFSPNAAWITYQGIYNASWGVFKVDVATKTITPLTTTETGFEGHSSYSSDGTKIIYISDEYTSGSTDIKIMNADGTNKVRVTNPTQNTAYPAFSPDGNKIIYSKQKTGAWDIYTINTNGTGTTLLISGFTTAFGGTYSPDGSKIAFFGDNGTQLGIFVANADGSNPVIIKSFPAGKDVSSRISWN